ncbi:MAG: hypothetical protein MJB14_15445, partial [Spirochaetes bacterium]|nr:hypothetical protein [Spirochaetota bacterium]
MYQNLKLTKSSSEAIAFLYSFNRKFLSYLEIIPISGHHLWKIDQASQFTLYMEKDVFSLIKGKDRINQCDFIHSVSAFDEKNNFTKKPYQNFYYTYNPYYLFKKWTHTQFNQIVHYIQLENMIVRYIPQPKFADFFFRYIIQEKARLNSINPFLKKLSDVEFFDPKVDPTKGFPVQLEYSLNNGQTWELLENPNHIHNIIDPIGNKRSMMYWFKQVDRKKSFKLQVTFGSQDTVDFLIYPFNMVYLNHYLLLTNSYFSRSKSYRDVYLLPLKVQQPLLKDQTSDNTH